MAAATARRIMTRLFLADRLLGAGSAPAFAGHAGGDGFDVFEASLTPAEREHPIAVWIARKRAALDWNENVCDMVSRYFAIPQKPLWPAESGNGYEAAAERLERRLRRAVRAEALPSESPGP